MDDDPVRRSWFDSEIEAYLRSVNASIELGNFLNQLATRRGTSYGYSSGTSGGARDGSSRSVIYVSANDADANRNWPQSGSQTNSDQTSSSSWFVELYDRQNPFNKILLDVLIALIILFCIAAIGVLGLALLVCFGCLTYRQLKRKLPSWLSCALP